MAGHSLTRTEASDHLSPWDGGPRLFLLHACSPGVQGLLFAGAGDAGFSGGLEEFFQQLGTALASHTVGGELDVPDRQARGLDPEPDGVVFGLLFRLLEDLIGAGEELLVEISDFRAVEDVRMSFALTDLCML